MDRVLRHAIEQGLNPVTAIQMMTINTAEHFGVSREMGMIAPGRWADVVLSGAVTVEQQGDALGEAAEQELAIRASKWIRVNTDRMAVTEQDRLAEIGSYLKRMGDAEIFSGVVVIARDGKPVLSQAYGYADREKKIPNTLETPFLMGSLSKLFTGLAIGQLGERRHGAALGARWAGSARRPRGRPSSSEVAAR